MHTYFKMNFNLIKALCVSVPVCMFVFYSSDSQTVVREGTAGGL